MSSITDRAVKTLIPLCAKVSNQTALVCALQGLFGKNETRDIGTIALKTIIPTTRCEVLLPQLLGLPAHADTIDCVVDVLTHHRNLATQQVVEWSLDLLSHSSALIRKRVGVAVSCISLNESQADAVLTRLVSLLETKTSVATLALLAKTNAHHVSRHIPSILAHAEKRDDDEIMESWLTCLSVLVANCTTACEPYATHIISLAQEYIKVCLY